eukprot:TRINITY_DN3320_c1_g3_i1.p1 TRINITY_DN3320_c1_g3~~TRINITY_DN3320_c1_g3_i1.p1  ORF type:complete len:69 (-),score=22.07 TRINITY_DN3320_c1_g3_i1:393-599(-)
MKTVKKGSKTAKDRFKDSAFYDLRVEGCFGTKIYCENGFRNSELKKLEKTLNKTAETLLYMYRRSKMV